MKSDSTSRRTNNISRHEVPVTCHPITIVHMDEDVVVVNKPASIPVSGAETAKSIILQTFFYFFI